MIIDEINETNFEEKLLQGQQELQVKFDAWNRLGKLRHSMKDEEFNKKASWLCRDPSIWAYATLRDKQDERLKVHPFQDKLINDTNRFVHAHAANQIGKTWALGDIKGLHHAIHVNNASVMVISSKEDQAKGILDEMKWMLKRTKIDYDELVGEVSNRTELHLYPSKKTDAVSVIRTFPPTTSILSFPSTLTIMDEDNFWEKIGELNPTEFYDQCIEPRSNATKNWKHPFLTMGQIVGITNPNGKQGLGYKCLEDPRFHNYIYCWLANPNNTLEEYLFHKERLPSYRFASIFAATYEDVAGGFITLDQYAKFASYNHKLIIDRNLPLFLGGDVASEDPKGKNTDWNIIYGVQQIERYEKDAKERLPRIKLVYLKEWKPKTPTAEIYKEIKKLTDSGITIAKFAYDKVGVGDKLFNDLIDRGILSKYQIEVLTYSLPNKSDVYINFQTLFEQGLIEGCDISELKKQIFGLKVEQPLGSVHLKIHHKTEGIKDDHPDALANACYAAKRLMGTLPSFTGAIKTEEKTKEAKLKTLVCPSCEKEGLDGYYQGYTKDSKYLARINCPKHIDSIEETKQKKKILIVGYPKVGKTIYSKDFDNVIHTDDYMKYGFKEQIYNILEDIETKDKWIIEGIQGIRLFRKMLQLNKCLPDEVIYLKPTYPVMDKHIGTRKMLDSVWKDCLELNKNIPIVYEELLTTI